MAEETQVSEEAKETSEEEGKAFTPITTQEDYDRITASIRHNVSKKFPDYEQLKEKAEKYDQLEESNKTELQKLQERAEAAEKKANALETEKQVEAWKKEVSSESGVPIEVLHGNTKEEIEAVAESVRHLFEKQTTPVVPGGATHQLPPDGSGDFLRDGFNKK